MSPTTVRRRTAFDPTATFRDHIKAKLVGKVLTNRADALKKRLKEYFEDAPEVYTNENGSKFIDFPETVEAEGLSFKGMELRRSVKTVFDEEKAERILKAQAEKDPTILEDAQSSYVDQEKVLRLVQEGRLTEKQLGRMMVDNESFAFWPVEGEVED